MNKKHEYTVVVGNLGTVHEGNNRVRALNRYRDYVTVSKDKCGRAAGEPVTLLEDGEPIKEHQGYQYMFDNFGADELQTLLSKRRAEDRHLCPVCSTGVLIGDLSYEDHVYYDEGQDHRIRIPCKCGGCGLEWMDVYRTVGVELQP